MVEAGLEKSKAELERVRVEYAAKLAEAQSAAEKAAQAAAAAQAASDAQAAAKAASDLAAARAAEERAKITLEQAAAVQTKLAAAHDLVRAVLNPEGGGDIDKALGTIGVAIPPPWNIVAAIGVPLIGWGVREWQMRRKNAVANAAAKEATDAAKSIVNAVDVLRGKAPEVAAAMSKNREAIREELTPLATAIVEGERLDSVP